MAFLASGHQPRTHAMHAPRLRLRWPSSLTFPLILFLIVTCFYWKLVFTYQFDWMWSPDMADQVLPWWQEEPAQLQHGNFPLWDTHNWMGQPFLGQAQPGAAYPLNWHAVADAARAWVHPDVGAQLWYYVLVHYMAALFCYFLCRDVADRRRFHDRGSGVCAVRLCWLDGLAADGEWRRLDAAGVPVLVARGARCASLGQCFVERRVHRNGVAQRPSPGPDFFSRWCLRVCGFITS